MNGTSRFKPECFEHCPRVAECRAKHWGPIGDLEGPTKELAIETYNRQLEAIAANCDGPTPNEVESVVPLYFPGLRRALGLATEETVIITEYDCGNNLRP